MSRILLIDDNDQFRWMLKLTLEKAGYEVIEASNTNDGLSITRKYFINLVIIDLYMPEIDGVHAIVKFKKEFPGLKIISMTGAYSDGRNEYLLTQAKEKGAEDVFKKTEEISSLLAKIKAILQ